MLETGINLVEAVTQAVAVKVGGEAPDRKDPTNILEGKQILPPTVQNDKQNKKHEILPK